MKIWVGLENIGVPKPGDDDKITSSDLGPLFEQFGVVTECVCFPNKNFAFVHMERDSQGTAAIENLNGYWIKGRSIKVESGERKGVQRYSEKLKKLGISKIAEGTTSDKRMASEAVRER